MKLYHGSANIINPPVFGFGKITNDYGQGFYCTRDIDLAKEWACGDNRNGFANEYEIDEKKQSILDLLDEKYTALNWIALLLNNRIISITSPIMKIGRDYLLDNFLVDISKYDIIKGYRADDSYFQYARAFLANTISIEQLSAALKLGNLGEQYVLKTKKAFKSIKFIQAIQAESNTYYSKRIQRNYNAEQSYYQLLNDTALSGIRLDQIIKEKISNDDPRIR